MPEIAASAASLESPSVQGGSKLSPWLIVFGSLLGALVLNAALGPVRIPPGTVLRMLLVQLTALPIEVDWPTTFEVIFWKIRLPHTALIALTGMALSGSGAAYQGLFRNPLADPYIIGVASGAGLGAVMVIAARVPGSLLGMATIPLAAFVGAMITVAVVYSIARVGRSTPVTTLILAGVAVSSFTTALTSLMMLISSDQLLRAITWLLGGYSIGGWSPVLISLLYSGLGLGFLFLLGRPLNVLQFGDDQALQMGLPVERVKLMIVVCASFVAATAISFTGIIGFIGLVVPHMVRLVWGSDYRRLIPLATFSGAVVLLLADIIARTMLAPREMPVGIITAVLGAPFFLWLLRRAKLARFW